MTRHDTTIEEERRGEMRKMKEDSGVVITSSHLILYCLPSSLYRIISYHIVSKYNIVFVTEEIAAHN